METSFLFFTNLINVSSSFKVFNLVEGVWRAETSEGTRVLEEVLVIEDWLGEDMIGAIIVDDGGGGGGRVGVLSGYHMSACYILYQLIVARRDHVFTQNFWLRRQYFIFMNDFEHLPNLIFFGGRSFHKHIRPALSESHPISLPPIQLSTSLQFNSTPHSIPFQMFATKVQLARKNGKTIAIKLLSSAGTGFFYTTRKNPQKTQYKFAFVKFDPIVKRRVLFTEHKIK